MPLKVLDIHRQVKMGRKRPSTPYAGHHLRDYLSLDKRLSAPPASPVTYGPKAVNAIHKIYGNNVLGCCVVSAVFHGEGVITGNANDGIIFSDPGNVDTAYGWCGYVPGDPSTDQGCEIQTVLNNWISLGLPGGGSKATGYLAINPADKSEIQTALYLFENLIFGMELPDAWTNPMPSESGFVWGVAGAPDPHQGHAVTGFGYTSTGVNIATWGMGGIITYEAVAKYCAASNNGELYAVLTPDLIMRGSLLSPDGLDWAALAADFAAMGGTVPPPQPTPVPITGMVPLPLGAYGIVIAAHGNRPQTVHNLPAGAIGIAVTE